jgi:hypothetical protein
VVVKVLALRKMYALILNDVDTGEQISKVTVHSMRDHGGAEELLLEC